MLPPEGDLTTNWNNLMNDHSKKMISLGLPEHVDLNTHITVGNSYEDVEYVRDN